MKMRLLAMGSIISVIGVGLLASRGLETNFIGIFLVGVVLLVIGLLWK
jgi:hypothetical protein